MQRKSNAPMPSGSLSFKYWLFQIQKAPRIFEFIWHLLTLVGYLQVESLVRSQLLELISADHRHSALRDVPSLLSCLNILEPVCQNPVYDIGRSLKNHISRLVEIGCDLNGFFLTEPRHQD
jgi:hypothetical protein